MLVKLANNQGLTVVHPYGSEQYARAFADIATPFCVSGTNTWLQKRPIPSSPHFDALGCYPACPLPNTGFDFDAFFTQLSRAELVSLLLISDTFFQPEVRQLEKYFDRVHPFKVHYLYDYRKPYVMGKHHRYELKRALESCTIDSMPFQEAFSGWQALASEISARAPIGGHSLFSTHYFSELLNLPGFFVTTVTYQSEVIGMFLWLAHENYLYSHMALIKQESHITRACYATYHYIIEQFGNSKVIDFGGGAGMQDDPADGLFKYKKGFANSSRMNYLCGKILQPEIYQQLSAHPPHRLSTSYFPAYRA